MPQKTKGEHINDAYSRLRISGLTVNPSAEDNQLALNRLEDFVSECEGRNICIGYNFEEEPDPATRSGVDKKYNEFIAQNLAVRLSPDFGKVDQLLINQANTSYSHAMAMSAKVNYSRPSRNMPIGSGNALQRFNNNSFYNVAPPAPISCETKVLEVGITRSYEASFIDFLNPDTVEEITSFTIEASNGLTLDASSINADLNGINFTVTPTESGWQKVIIQIVTTDSTPNKADERVINFNVTQNTVNEY